MTTYENRTENSTGIDDCLILKRHWFAEEVVADTFGKDWVAPEDRDFTDRPPPGAPASVKPKPAPTVVIVDALRSKRRRRAA